MSKPNGILAMSPDQYREIDGVVFDLDSFAKHCGPAETSQPDTVPPPEADAIPAPAGILALDPAHYRALDGVVMDQDSYERHCCPPPQQKRKQLPRTVYSPAILSRRAGIPQKTASLLSRGWAAPCPPPK